MKDKVFLFALTVLLLAFVFSYAQASGFTFPSEITEIADEAFMDNNSLSTVALPEGILSIGSRAFAGSSLKTIYLPSSLRSIASDTFSDCPDIVIQAPVGSYAYDWAVNNGYIEVPETPLSSFSYNLDESSGTAEIINYSGDYTYVVVPEKIENCDVVSIGYGAFSGSNLMGISLPNTITQIDSTAFYNCKSLISIVLPDRLESIRDWVFAGCENLQRITLPDSLISIDERAFYFCLQLTDIRLPSNLEFIGNYAFSDCISLNRLVLPDSLKSIGECAFYSCRSLSEFALPSNLETLESGVCFGCTGLINLIIPEHVTTIKSNAFAGLSAYVTFTGDAPAIAKDAFNSSNIIAFYPHDKTGWESTVNSTYGARWLLWRADNEDKSIIETEKDASETLSVTVSNNNGKNEYVYEWNRGVITSYLTHEGDGTYTRVEYADERIHIEQYDQNLNLVWKKTLQPELPKWGGFYSGNEYNFLICGKDNVQADDDAEVIRVIRYSKEWKRIDSASIKGVSTKYPFDFGTVTAMQVSDILYIHTSRGMYNDHQANLNLKIYIPTMQSFEEETVYVSHSFNQFVREDGKNIVWLNHGDAYPRALQLVCEKNSAGSLANGEKTALNLMEFGGSLEDELYQNTYANIGGFEVSGSHYLVAGKSIDQSKYKQTDRKNICIISVNKNKLTSSGVVTNWITDYPDSDKRNISTPQLVKVSSDKFLLLWTEAAFKDTSSQLHYVFLDRQGNATSEIFVNEGSLSDCQPIVCGTKAMWYVTSNSTSVFYSIDLNNPSMVTAKYA